MPLSSILAERRTYVWRVAMLPRRILWHGRACREWSSDPERRKMLGSAPRLGGTKKRVAPPSAASGPARPSRTNCSRWC